MVKFKTHIKDDNNLKKIYDHLIEKYGNIQKQFLGEIKMYTVEEDCNLIKNPDFYMYAGEYEGITYTSVYFVFDSRVPFHVLETVNNKIIIVDEFFDDVDYKDEILPIVVFDDYNEALYYIDETYDYFLTNQFNIINKYY